MTDQQQADVVRSWLRENGLYLAVGVFLGLAALFGWSQWQTAKNNRAASAAVVYDQLLKAVTDSKFEAAQAAQKALSTEHAGSVYHDQGRLLMARMLMDRNDPGAAAEELRAVVNGSSPEDIRAIARLRLARVLIWQDKADEALKLLASSASAAFGPAVHEVRGDAFLAQGKTNEARSEYEQALADKDAVINRTLVKAKLDDLGGPLTTATPAEPAVAPDAPAPPAG
jgi:predicted negative regulator of RcsB-dependent stress response